MAPVGANYFVEYVADLIVFFHFVVEEIDEYFDIGFIGNVVFHSFSFQLAIYS